LGLLYQHTKDNQAALSAFQEALNIRERLAQTNPATHEPEVASLQSNLGIFYQQLNDYKAALNSFQKALVIWERLAQTNPNRYEIEYCKSIVLLANLQQIDYQENRQLQIDKYLGIAKKILPKYQQVRIAKTMMDRVSKQEDYFTDLKLIAPIQKLRNLAQKTQNLSEKIKILNRIIDQYRLHVANGHSNFIIELANNLVTLSWYQISAGQFYEAEISAREALNPTQYIKIKEYDEKIEWAKTTLALALLFQGKYKDAETIYRIIKDKPYNNGTYTEAFLADFDELEQAGITHPDVAKIKALLKKNN
jgi:tetratricopeptide (TPR) repeat protein